MNGKYELTLLIGTPNIRIKKDLEEDIVEKCRRESTTFDKLCRELRMEELEIWNRW